MNDIYEMHSDYVNRNRWIKEGRHHRPLEVTRGYKLLLPVMQLLNA